MSASQTVPVKPWFVARVLPVATDSAAERRTRVAVAGHDNDPVTARSGLDDDETTVRIAALRSLGRLQDLHVDELTEALRDPSPAVRIAAIELAAFAERPEIASLLDDEEPMVVESAAWALGEREDNTPSTIKRLASIAGDHDDPLAREAAVAALGAIGDERGLPAILAATTDKPAVRRRAIISLVAFEGPEVDAAWERARTDRDRQVRDAVEELLGPET
jgi:HEAT repeat protein